MKCEEVQELFPELREFPNKYSEARKHLETCSNCKTLFHIFDEMIDDTQVDIDPVKRDLNFITIQKKMKRHDRVLFTRRVSGVAAVFLLAFFSILSLNQSPGVSIADISADVLYLQSESTMVPEVSMDKEAIIEYLVEYENLESIGELF